MDRRAALMVALGGALGASVRWGVIETFDSGRHWPTATFVVNIAGSLVLGVLASRYRHLMHTSVVVGATTGFCGALTTFSSFAVDVAVFMRDDRWGLAGVYLCTSIAAGLAAFVVGTRAGRPRLSAAER